MPNERKQKCHTCGNDYPICQRCGHIYPADSYCQNCKNHESRKSLSIRVWELETEVVVLRRQIDANQTDVTDLRNQLHTNQVAIEQLQTMAAQKLEEEVELLDDTLCDCGNSRCLGNCGRA